MELLDGATCASSRRWPTATPARYLRDVASSLRCCTRGACCTATVSPRNVRCATDGRCKLIDFGALSGFGVPDLVVGTPPFIAPEALHGLALDQRADLYSLGALAYSCSPAATRIPRARSKRCRGCGASCRRGPRSRRRAREPGLARDPAELDDLVMSLLTLDPLGRPASAAEVIDRLTRIAELPRDEDDSAAASSYLVGVPTRRSRARARQAARAPGSRRSPVAVRT